MNCCSRWRVMVAFCVAMLFFGEGFENAVVQNLYKICTIRFRYPCRCKVPLVLDI